MYTDSEDYKLILNNLWSYPERHQVRYYDYEFKDFIVTWNHYMFNTSKRVGALMAAAGKLPFEANRKDWVKHYFTTVRSPEQVVEQVKEMAETCGLSFQKALNWWWIHIMDSTFSGWESERDVTAILKVWAAETGNTVRHATDHEDRNEGIDVVVEDSSGRTIMGIQIKVQSYFLSTRSSVVNARTQLNPPKYRKFTNRTGAPVYYVIIEPTLQTGEIHWKQPVY